MTGRALPPPGRSPTVRLQTPASQWSVRAAQRTGRRRHGRAGPDPHLRAQGRRGDLGGRGGGVRFRRLEHEQLRVDPGVGLQRQPQPHRATAAIAPASTRRISTTRTCRSLTAMCRASHSQSGQPSKIEVSACNATTPAICFFNRQSQARVHRAGRAGNPQCAGRNHRPRILH